MRTASTESVSAVVQLSVVIATGLGLAFLIPRVPASVTFAALLVWVYGLTFLNRPDLGLMSVLLARASTDLSLQFAPPMFVGRNWIASVPNIGLISILIVAGLLFILARRVPLVALPGAKLLILILLIGTVGMLRSDSAILSFNDWLPVLSLLVTYALAAHLFREPQRIRRVIDVIAVSFILPALFGFYQLVSGIGYTDVTGLPAGVHRIFGTFVHPNGFGLYLVVVLSVFLPVAVSETGKRKFVALVIVLASATLLTATFARASWVGALIVLLTVGVLRSRGLLLLVPLAILLVVTLEPSVAARLADPLGGSFADRVDLWQGTLQNWLHATNAGGAPLVTMVNRLAGLGPGSVELLTIQVRGTPFVAHNDYLRVLVEYGVFGLVLYLGLLILLVRQAFRTWKLSPHAAGGVVALSFLSLILADSIMSITDNLFAQTANQVYFWTLAGLTVAVSRSSNHDMTGGAQVTGRTAAGIWGVRNS